ncbi:MAG: DNA translocase FtsK 4TM domain-containing protein [Deferribacteraceae bacterium]|jgi:hypothetical protein|nr:DNA translocase FtsK 4TM domain-containing protein [Deferribacteraceae bacterium]
MSRSILKNGNKAVNLPTQPKYFYEVFFVLLVLAALFTGLSLFSYSSDDPSYSNIVFIRYDVPVANIFGTAGAYTADFLGMLFGWTALMLPFGCIYALVTLVRVYRHSFSGIKAAGRITEALLLIAVLSMFTGLVAETDFFFPDKTGGGLLGVLSTVVIASFLGKVGGVILCTFFIMVLLFALLRVSILEIIDKINSREKHVKTKPAGYANDEDDDISLPVRVRDSLLILYAGLKQRHSEWIEQKRTEKEERDQRKLAEIMQTADEQDDAAESVRPYYMAETTSVQAVTDEEPTIGSVNLISAVEEAEPEPDIDLGDIIADPMY